MLALRRSVILFAVSVVSHFFIGMSLPAAEPAATKPSGESFSRWKSHIEKLQQDPSLVRLYLFDEGKGLTTANIAGDKKGLMTIISNSPYGESREQRWWLWNSPLFQTFPEWSEGRWPGKGAMRNGLARICVVRSQFNGTKNGIFSLEAWVRPHNEACRLFDIGDGYGSGFKITYNKANWSPDGQIEFRMGTATGPGIVSATPFNPGIWHQLVCMWDGKMLKIFIDGVQKAEKEFAGPYVSIPMTEQWALNLLEMDIKGLHIGGIGNGGGRFDVDELAIFDRALSADEVRSHFEAGNPSAPAEEQKASLAKTLDYQKVLNSISMDIPRETSGYFQRGVKIPSKISIPASSGLNGKFTAHFLLRDLRNTVVVDETRELTASPDKEATASIELAPALCGIYFLDMWLTDGDGKIVKKLAEEYCIAITVPVPPPEKVPFSSPLATHHLSGSFFENRFIGIGVDRWIKGSEAYKKFGEVDPKVFEKEMEFERKSGLKVMFCLHTGMPAWAERVPGKKFLLKDMNIWADYCKQMVRLYKDMVVAWEIENEPNAGNLITPEEYVEFLKVGYKAIKEEDPKSIVVGLCGCPGFLNWNEAVFKLGGAKDFDVLSLHHYLQDPIRTHVQEKEIERAAEQLLKYRGEMVPIWNSESAFHTVTRVDGRPMTEDVFMRRFGAKITKLPGQPPVLAADMPVLLEHDAAAWQVQAILLDLAAGCKKYFMLNGPSHYSPPFNVSDGQPTEVGPAVAALASVLIPSRSVEKLLLSSNSDAGAIITQEDGRRIAAVFSDENPTLSFKVDRPGTFEGMDLLGNPLKWTVSTGNILNIKLGRDPVYVFDVPKDFAQLQFLKVGKAPKSLPESGIMEGELTLINHLDKALSATLKGTAPKGSTLEVNGKIELKAGGSMTVPFRLDGQKLGRRNYEITFELLDGSSQLGKLSHSFLSEGGIHRIPEIDAKSSLGDGTWWKKVEPETCIEEDNVVYGKPIVGVPWAPQWRGAKDLSFTTKMAWQPDGAVFIRVEVADDVIMAAPKDKRGMCFQYDCIELFFDGRGLGERKNVMEPGVEQMLVIPNSSKTAAPCDFWFPKNTPTIRAEFVGAASETGYWIEGKIFPEPGCSFRVKAGSQFAFDVMVDDTDAEIAPRKAAMALHGLFNNSSDPSKWGRYQLETAKGK
ncbi:MAG: LamG-like jellyroll fold domain-containing protein [Victivallales bacterium]